MRYAKVSTKCSKCGEAERVSGQRYCKACRAAAERERRRRKHDEFLALVAFRAAALAGQIEKLNEGTR